MADKTVTVALIGQDRMSPAFDKAGVSADKAGTKMKAFGKGAAGAAAAGGAVAGVALSKGLMDNLDIEAGRAKLAGQLGLTKGDAAKAGQVSGAVYADNFGGSIEEVNGALKSVSQNLGDVAGTSKVQLQSMTEDALALASTFDVDVNGATSAAAALIKNGLAKDATAAFDIITAGMQNGADKAGDFLDTLTEYSPQFSKLGFDGKDSLNLLSAGLKAGARDTDVIADAFKEFGIRSIDGTTLTAQGFKAAGLNAKDMATEIGKGGDSARAATQKTLDGLLSIKDPIKQNTAGTALFGTQWEDTVRQILPALAKADGQIKTVDGTTKAMSETVGDTAAGRIETAKRKFEQWTQSMADSDSALGLVTTGVSAFGGGALAGASQVGTLAVALRGTAAAEKTMTVATAILNGGMKAMRVSATLMLGPWGLVILAVAALAAGLIYAYKHSETFRTIVNGVFKAVGVAVLDMASDFLGAFAKMFDVLGHLPGKAGAAFRSLAKQARNAQGEIEDVKDSLRGVKSKYITLTVRTAVTTATNSAIASAVAGRISAAAAVKVRERGGPVAKGEAYIVGERRPELFVPDSSGTIIPDLSQYQRGSGSSAAGGAGAGAGLTMNFYLTGLTDELGITRAVVQAISTAKEHGFRIPAGTFESGGL